MAKEYKAYNSFVGYNDSVNPDNMLDSELRKCENAITSISGGFASRPGADKVNAASYAAQANWVKEWPFSDGSVKLISMVGSNLCLTAENGTQTVKIALSNTEIGHCFYKDAMYFVDGASYKVWGWLDYGTQSGSVTIALGHVVKNFPISTHATTPGVAGHFYKAKAGAAGTYDLISAPYGDATKWDDITNGALADHIIDVPAYVDANNDLTPIKRCKYIEFHSTSFRFFFGGDSANPAALYYSEPDKPNFVKGINQVYPTSASGPVTGLKSFIKSMLVSYKRSWRVWDGISVGVDATWRALAIPYGCVANDTICLTPNSLTFEAVEGICMMAPSILSTDVQLMIDKEVFTILSSKKIDVTMASMVNKQNNKAVFHDGKYYLSYCDDAVFAKNNKVIVLDWDTKGFNKYSGWQVNCWCPRENGDILFGSKNYILKANTGYDDIDVETGLSKAISWEVQTKPLNCGTPMNKDFLQLFITAQQFVTSVDQSICTIDLLTDYVTTSMSTDLNESLVWGRSWGKLWGFAETINQWAPVNQTGFRIQATFKGSSANNPIFIYQLMLAFEQISDVKGDPITTGLLIT